MKKMNMGQAELSDIPLKKTHKSSIGTVTVEWVMVITVALTVLVAIYYFAQWAMNTTAESVKKVEGKDS